MSWKNWKPNKTYKRLEEFINNDYVNGDINLPKPTGIPVVTSHHCKAKDLTLKRKFKKKNIDLVEYARSWLREHKGEDPVIQSLLDRKPKGESYQIFGKMCDDIINYVKTWEDELTSIDMELSQLKK